MSLFILEETSAGLQEFTKQIDKIKQDLKSAGKFRLIKLKYNIKFS